MPRAYLAHADTSQCVEVTAELKVLLRPLWAEQQHHDNVYDKVKGQDEHGDDSCPVQGVQDAGYHHGNREVAEPQQVEHQEAAVEDEFEATVLDEVNLPHLPQDVEEEEEAVGEVEACSHALVVVILLSGVWEQCLQYL